MEYKRIVYVFLLSIIILGITGCVYEQKQKINKKFRTKRIPANEKIEQLIKTTNMKIPKVINTPIRKYIPTEVFFDGFDGKKVDSAFWNRVSREKKYNRELQTYVPKNCFVRDGYLVLSADSKNGKYTSGLVNTKSKIEFQYGTVEVRLKYPEGKSFFPAVWMLPADNTSFPEIDIFEVVGHHPDKIYSVYHYYKNEQKKVFGVTSIENYLDFHTYKFEWTPDEMIWYIDENKVFSTQNEIPDEPMFLIINFAVGGIWPGDPNEDTVFPSEVLVDYVRITPHEMTKTKEVDK